MNIIMRLVLGCLLASFALIGASAPPARAHCSPKKGRPGCHEDHQANESPVDSGQKPYGLDELAFDKIPVGSQIFFKKQLLLEYDAPLKLGELCKITATRTPQYGLLLTRGWTLLAADQATTFESDSAAGTTVGWDHFQIGNGYFYADISCKMSKVDPSRAASNQRYSLSEINTSFNTLAQIVLPQPKIEEGGDPNAQIEGDRCVKSVATAPSVSPIASALNGAQSAR